MPMLMHKYIDKFLRRPYWKGRSGFETEWRLFNFQMPDNVRPLPGLVCRACGKPAQLELTTDESERMEYLCYEDLGPFLELFTHPGIREWTIVRLP